MAPCNMRTPDHQADSGLRKLRKPVIEKLRRDRINSSIEQLRVLLEKEFQRHQLPSKPEKADILEMTVTFLQRHMAERDVTASSQAQREGYSTCAQDAVTFLPVPNQQDGSFCSGYPVSYELSTMKTSKKASPFTGNKNKSMWRPW
ncbi:transcription factor HES-5-like isoform X2 [Dendrobates tinctorius]|uniref:transcription factor HES-5-like isoform X2 n=1 Tax=Dendrobates tinctorius TaxID=92724 RepID=UPI003CC93F63